MKLLRHIGELVSRLDRPEKFDTSFIFPYSTDDAIKRQQIIDNLQKGLLLEDKGIFIPWLTPFNKVYNFKEQRRDTGDRTEWYLGKRTILDGYIGVLEVMKWAHLPWTNPITKIHIDLGHDQHGNKCFHELNDHLIEKLGQPHNIDMEKWGKLDLGTIEWKFEKVKLTLTGYERFAARYILHVGLVKDRNQEYFQKVSDRLKVTALTEKI